jgi:hypothetical protein
MMRNFATRLLIVLIIAVGMAACTSKPIYNVESNTFVTPSAPLSVRSEQIRRAAVGLGWQVENVAPGQMQATRNQRNHQAMVLINYTPEKFSIRYFASSNLNYTGTEIHRAYNQWVKELEDGIKAQSSI